MMPTKSTYTSASTPSALVAQRYITEKELPSMRIASFNVENLFSRARVMNLEDWSEGREILTDFSVLNNLLQKPVYTDPDKQEILAAIERLGLNQDDETAFVILRQNRGRLLKRPQSGPPEVVAGGRSEWIGWLELKTEAVNAVATEMTAKVIQEVNADILAVVEAEDRIALVRFNEQLLKPINATYSGIMLIDGNDDRGIDVGFLTKPGFILESMVSHVDDMANGLRIFSRDCPEFTVRVNETTTILVLVNHFKSKGFGSQASSNARRTAQAKRVREIYNQRRLQGIDLIAIIGDLNDTPASDPLQSLLAEGSDLQDIFAHPQFQSDGRPGTFGNGTRSSKIDYILLSPALFEHVTTGGILRKGVWGGQHGTLFPHYDEMTKPIHAASDHAAIWADINF
jgi:endonuclease/exonuclease/phosphatase family metal-dependent hydrolase